MSNAPRYEALLAGTQPKSVTGPRPPWFSAITSRPATLGNHDSVDTAFNGDISRVILPIEHRIIGADTLGLPTSSYLYTPETSGIYLYSYNASGWNQSTTGNGGRTGATAMRVKLVNIGQGDHVAYNASAFVNGTKTGSTDFLANPAAVLFNGDMVAGADGVYLNPYETICVDGGFDVACVGIVNNFVRTNATGAKSAYWLGYRAQNTGTQPIDNIVSATGLARVGLDFSMTGLNFGATKAAISLKADDRIYFNNSAGASGALRGDIRTTTFNNDYIEYSSSNSALNFVAAGVSAMRVSSTQLRFSVPLFFSTLPPNYANDAAAATGGVAIGGVYRNGSVLQVRVA